MKPKRVTLFFPLSGDKPRRAGDVDSVGLFRVFILNAPVKYTGVELTNFKQAFVKYTEKSNLLEVDVTLTIKGFD